MIEPILVVLFGLANFALGYWRSGRARRREIADVRWEAYQRGRDAGYVVGDAAGYQRGRDQAHDASHNRGFQAGYKAGRCQGRADGFLAGHRVGWNAARETISSPYRAACILWQDQQPEAWLLPKGE